MLFVHLNVYGTSIAHTACMKTDKSIVKQETVSQIVQTTTTDGEDMIGFTVYSSDGTFFNVMRSFTASDYEEVYSSIVKERNQILERNPKKGENK